MNRRIIALRGRGEIGKTTTILLLPGLLQSMGWELVSRQHPKKTDTKLFKYLDILL